VLATAGVIPENALPASFTPSANPVRGWSGNGLNDIEVVLDMLDFAKTQKALLRAARNRHTGAITRSRQAALAAPAPITSGIVYYECLTAQQQDPERCGRQSGSFEVWAHQRDTNSKLCAGCQAFSSRMYQWRKTRGA
jgi:hypothetical protein